MNVGAMPLTVSLADPFPPTILAIERAVIPLLLTPDYRFLSFSMERFWQSHGRIRFSYLYPQELREVTLTRD